MKRPHIPLETSCRVAFRQLGIEAPVADFQIECAKSLLRLLGRLLAELRRKIGADALQLDHNPALALRKFNKRTGKWTPGANDPNFLLYREKHAHHIKTNVRGDGAQFSDTALMKRERRRRKKKAGKRLNYRWPRRKLQSRNSFSRQP